MRIRLACAALTSSACLAADLPVQPIGNQQGSLLLQLRPPVGFQDETLSITATIRGTHAARTRRMTTGASVHFRYSNQEDSLVLLVCVRDAHGLLGEPIAILEQARTTTPTPSTRQSSLSPAPRPRHAMIPWTAQGQCPRCLFATTAANAAHQWVSETCCDLVTRCALDVDIPLLVRRCSGVRRGARKRLRQRGRGDASLGG